MKTLTLLLLLTAPILAVEQPSTPSQKFQRPAKPLMTELSGTVKGIEKKECTRRFCIHPFGSHLILQVGDNQVYDLHLGPSPIVEKMVEGIKPGDKIKAEVFAHPMMQKNEFIVKSIKIGDKKIVFRNDNLKPVWSGRGGRW